MSQVPTTEDSLKYQSLNQSSSTRRYHQPSDVPPPRPKQHRVLSPSSSALGGDTGRTCSVSPYNQSHERYSLFPAESVDPRRVRQPSSRGQGNQLTDAPISNTYVLPSGPERTGDEQYSNVSLQDVESQPMLFSHHGEDEDQYDPLCEVIESCLSAISDCLTSVPEPVVEWVGGCLTCVCGICR